MSQDIRNFLDKLPHCKSIAIISHNVPDADAFCSAIALRDIIRGFHSFNEKAKKQKIDIFIEMQDLPASLKIFVPEKGLNFLNPEKHQKQYDMAFCLDCASIDRMGKYKDIFQSSKYTVNIDHHSSNNRFATDNFILKTSSTCEALFYLFLHKKDYELSQRLLSLLYSGVITDTNNLRNNADSIFTKKFIEFLKQNLRRSFRNKIKANFFERISPAREIINQHIYNKNHIKFLKDNKICLTILSNNIIKKAGAEMEDAEGIVDEGLYKKGVLLSAFFIENNKGEYYVKLRGKEGVDVLAVAQQFEGGGNIGQAAFQFKGKLSKLLSKFIPIASEVVKDIEEKPINNYSELYEF